MYRYSVDNAVTYTSEDLVLFKESPFASFMERLTLENSGHGIPPDVDSAAPADTIRRQDELADTLSAEDREVSLIEWDAEEPIRRNATLEAMRHGVDFIVNGQLALGPLSGSSNLLMRTSGYSELGNYLYVPCDTQGKTGMQSAFRLCFLADLLHSLQGQLPPQMLIIRGGSDVLPLKTEDHIFHYLAVKQRFMSAQRDFRKHRMPNPAESSAFGRWGDCANEVMKQRMLAAAEESEIQALPEPVEEQLPMARAVGELQNPGSVQQESTEPGGYRKGLQVNDTLAAQALSLSPAPQYTEAAPLVTQPLSAPSETLTPMDVASPSPVFDSPILTSFEPDNAGEALDSAAPDTVAPPEQDEADTEHQENNRLHNVDAALMNLQFIGSRLDEPQQRAPSQTVETVLPERRRSRQEPPPSNLGDIESLADNQGGSDAESLFSSAHAPSSSQAGLHPLDTVGFNVGKASMVDRDELPPRPTKPEPRRESSLQLDEYSEDNAPAFSSSLITNERAETDD
ncbi:MAG: hypothetical protein V7742_15685 [Halioglobus sp.]